MRAWLAAHRAALADALRRFVRAPLGVLLTLLALGSALALPLAGFLALDSLGVLAERFGTRPQITVYLAPAGTPADLARIAQAARALPDADEVRTIPRDQALAELARTEGMRDLLAGLGANPLPDAIVVKPRSRDAAAFTRLQKALSVFPGVAEVQLDVAWVERLNAIVTALELLVGAIAVLLAIGIVTMVFNTIRLQVLTRSDEIEIATLFGATPAYVRRPFLYFGALQGLAAGAVALAIAAAAFAWLSDVLGPTLRGLGLAQLFRLPSATDAVAVLAFGAFLGWAGARISVAARVGWASAAR